MGFKQTINHFLDRRFTLGSGINVRRTFINFWIFSQPYTLIPDRTFIKFDLREKFFMSPIHSTHQDKPICTLEYMVWHIRTGSNLPFQLL